MNWLEFNYVHINCYNKTLRFPKFGDNGELMLLSSKQVNELMEDKSWCLQFLHRCKLIIKFRALNYLLSVNF